MEHTLNIFQKSKTYKFQTRELDKIYVDIRKEKLDKINNAIWYSGMIAMYMGGIIGTQFVVTYMVGVTTSRTVKWLMKRKK